MSHFAIMAAGIYEKTSVVGIKCFTPCLVEIIHCNIAIKLLQLKHANLGKGGKSRVR